MSADNLAVIKAMYDAFAAGDMPGVVGSMSPDITWHEAENYPYADQSPYHGPEAIVAGVFKRSMEEWDNFEITMNSLIDGGDRIVAVGRYMATFKETGRRMNPQAVHIWTLKDGKATSFQQLIDTLDVARATGAV